MTRLLKFVTIFFVAMTLLMPIVECFDCWDRPGLTNDTEFPVFVITLFLSLVFLALVAMARRFFDKQNERIVTEILYEILTVVFDYLKEIVLTPFIIPPLRI